MKNNKILKSIILVIFAGIIIYLSYSWGLQDGLEAVVYQEQIKGKIISINNNEITIRGSEDNSLEYRNNIILKTDNNTKFKDTLNEDIKLNNLKLYQEVTIYFNYNKEIKIDKDGKTDNILQIKINKDVTNNEMEIKLESNPSTGYNWEISNYDKNIIKISKYYEDSCNDNAVGCGGYDVFVIESLKEGTTKVAFNYKRSGEKNILLNATYKFTVDENLNITQTHNGTYFKELEE